MATFDKMWQAVVGKPLDPLDPRTRHAIAVTPLLAWVGLGADGLSSSCYGPEEAFLALGQHTPLALFPPGAVAIALQLRCWASARDWCPAPHCWSTTY
jgi:hypothetical protein